ncbi:TolC family protein [Scleromatobacter humisilvae]|uniref:TolC family protein n=1 Tax=Scleromatobacter humisilvae TaxID=2897159 RepID=A0A9X2C3G0_9BURK|nr:TolC family protein [Scleromatobacter humisilvae]MCK9688129.1 TolC family protein [Scleromatobacter humisilvae]
MTSTRPIARVALATAALALAGCAATKIDDNIAAAHAEVTARGGPDFAWLTTDAAQAQARDDVAHALTRPLSEDAAVRIALSHSPALQALLFDRAAASADATQSARLPNPVFAFERLASGGSPNQIELTRALSVSLLDVLLLPARAARADDAQRRLRLQLAVDVLRAADAARRAWVDAVAADEAMRYAEQVGDTAQAAGELARRMESAGNFSALQRAREEAFLGSALVDLAQARRAQRGARETLVRALGLDSNEAAALRLPEHLPDLPAALPSGDAADQAALNGRLDLRLARARLDELAHAQGLARVAGTVNGLDVGAERRERTGLPREHGLTLSVPLPLFDTGDAGRAAANARYDAALARASALAVAAASQLRAADAERRDAHALALQFRDRLVPLQATIVGENLLRYNGMLASTFDLLADAREQARVVQQAIAAQRDFWLADAAFQAAALGLSDTPIDIAEAR